MLYSVTYNLLNKIVTREFDSAYRLAEFFEAHKLTAEGFGNDVGMMFAVTLVEENKS